MKICSLYQIIIIIIIIIISDLAISCSARVAKSYLNNCDP